MRGEEYNMPTDIQFKDDLRKEEIRIENELEQKGCFPFFQENSPLFL